MNEQEKKELKQKEQEKNERRIITATALDIAVKLTNADHTWLKQDDDGNVVMDEPLYRTVRLVMRAINDDFFMAVSGVPKVVKGITRDLPVKS